MASLDTRETVIRPSGNLRVNARWGAIGSMDYSRIRNETSPDVDDAQYGLGSLMNHSSAPYYPACEAGSAAAWSGYFCFGLDRTCTGDCGGTTGGTRDIDYDYAIFIRGEVAPATVDASLLGNSAATAATSCNALKTARPTAPSGAYWLDVDGPSGNAASQTWCQQTLSSGGWTLAANLDSSDGNVRAWSDTGFWTTASSFGVASGALSNDFKSGAVFAQSGYTQLMIVVHREGLETVGWRAWSLANTNSLQTVFSTSALAGPPLGTTPTALTGASFASDVAALSSVESVVRPADTLRVNVSWGATTSQDYSRIRVNGAANVDDAQYGLGSLMNHSSAPTYPACEVGTISPWSGYFCVGTDRTCSTCGEGDWGTRDLEYDYAIYVR